MDGDRLVHRMRQAHLEQGLVLPAVAFDHLGIADDQREPGAGAVVVQDHPLGLQAQRIVGKDRTGDIGQFEHEVLVGLDLATPSGADRDDRAGLACSDRQGRSRLGQVHPFLGGAIDRLVLDRDIGTGRLGQGDDEDEVSTKTAVGLENLGAGDGEHRE